MVAIIWPPQDSSRRSRYLAGIASRPLASRLTALAPRNTSCYSPVRPTVRTTFRPIKSTLIHYTPLLHTIESRPDSVKSPIHGKALYGEGFAAKRGQKSARGRQFQERI